MLYRRIGGGSGTGQSQKRGEQISSLQCAVHDIMRADWQVTMRSGVTNVVHVYTTSLRIINPIWS